MTTLAVAPPLFGEVEREPTLDDVVVRAWEGVSAREVAQCPVCHGEMGAEYSAHARPIGGRCSDCGSMLR